MIRQIIFIIIFIGGYLSSSVFAVGQGSSYTFLKEPAIKWNDERLQGEVKNAPVKNLITELLQRTGTEDTFWEVNGNLEGSMSISFDNLTIDESIKKIMRHNRFNYTLIFDERQPRDTNSFQRIKELAIYRKDQTIRFSRTAKQIPSTEVISSPGTSKPVIGKPADSLPAAPLAAKSTVRNTPRSEPTNEEIEGIDEEMRAIADELLAEEKISQEEYDALIGEIEAEE